MVGSGWAHRCWLSPKEKERFSLFPKIIFVQKENPEKSRKLNKATKNTLTISKISGEFPNIDWHMNNPNKIFRAHKKYFRAF
jgi:hypothetical protein